MRIGGMRYEYLIELKETVSIALCKSLFSELLYIFKGQLRKLLYNNNNDDESTQSI